MAQDQDPFDAAKWAALDSQGGGAAQVAPETYGSDLPLRTPNLVQPETYSELPSRTPGMPQGAAPQQPAKQIGKDWRGKSIPSVDIPSGRTNPTGWGAPPSYGEPYTEQKVGDSIKRFFGSIIGGIPGVAPYKDGYDMSWLDNAHSYKYPKVGQKVLDGLEYVDAQINGPRTDQWPPRYVTGPGGMAKPRGNPNVRQGEEQWSDVWTGNGYADGWMGTEALSGQRAQLAELMARGGSDPMGTIFGPVADSVTGLGRGVYNYATQPTQQMTQYNQGIHGTPNTQDYGGAYDSYNQMLQDYTAPHSLQSLRPQKFYSGGAY